MRYHFLNMAMWSLFVCATTALYFKLPISLCKMNEDLQIYTANLKQWNHKYIQYYDSSYLLLCAISVFFVFFFFQKWPAQQRYMDNYGSLCELMCVYVWMDEINNSLFMTKTRGEIHYPLATASILILLAISHYLVRRMVESSSEESHKTNPTNL